MNKPFRKSWLGRTAILGIVVSLVGISCGIPSADTGIVDDFPTEPLTLTIWRPVDERSSFREFARGYRELHSNVSFNYETIDAANYETEVLNALATGNGPDIISIPNDALARYVDKLVAMPDQFYSSANPVAAVSSKYAPAATTDLISDGKVYGVPLYTDTLSLFWNRKIFRETLQAKIRAQESFNDELLIRAPADWTEVVETTKLLTKRADNQINLSAIALGSTGNVPESADIIAALMLQQETEMVTADRGATAFHLPASDDPNFYPGATVLEFLKSFSDPNSDHYTWNASEPNAIQAFLDGEVAMMINYKEIIPYINQRNPELEYTTAPLPQIANTSKIIDYASYRMEAVTNNSKYSKVAWDFLKYANDFGLPDYTSITGRTSPARSSQGTSTVLERTFRQNPYSLQIPTAQSWHKGADPIKAEDLLVQALDRVVAGQSARDSLNQAAAEFNKLLAK